MIDFEVAAVVLQTLQLQCIYNNKSLYLSVNVFSTAQSTNWGHVLSRSNWNLEVLVFEERRKPEYPEKNLSEQGREPTTNSTHIHV